MICRPLKLKSPQSSGQSPLLHTLFCTGSWLVLQNPRKLKSLPSLYRLGDGGMGLGSAIGFLSRADQGIGVFWHAAPPTRLCLKFPRETGLILMCARKVGNAFQTKQGNRTSCRDHSCSWAWGILVPCCCSVAQLCLALTALSRIHTSWSASPQPSLTGL